MTLPDSFDRRRTPARSDIIIAAAFRTKRCLPVFGAIALAFAAGSAVAQDDAKARDEMQKQLNQQVMSSPFNAGDIRKAEAYAEEAKKSNVTPVAQAPTYWAPGWTCANLTSYQYYYYNDYRNCVYYHHYYGRYWR